MKHKKLALSRFMAFGLFAFAVVVVSCQNQSEMPLADTNPDDGQLAMAYIVNGRAVAYSASVAQQIAQAHHVVYDYTQNVVEVLSTPELSQAYEAKHPSMFGDAGQPQAQPERSRLRANQKIVWLRTKGNPHKLIELPKSKGDWSKASKMRTTEFKKNGRHFSGNHNPAGAWANTTRVMLHNAHKKNAKTTTFYSGKNYTGKKATFKIGGNKRADAKSKIKFKPLSHKSN